MNTTAIKVELLAFESDVKFRIVDIPSDKIQLSAGSINLDLVFYYGQNDFQPKNCNSVSVGDVVHLPNGEKWMVKLIGFGKLSEDEYTNYISMDLNTRIRYKHKHLRGRPVKNTALTILLLLSLSGCAPVFAQTVSEYAAFTKRWEGYSAAAYRDAGGRSIGYGHHIQRNERIPSTICREVAEKLLLADIRRAVVYARRNVRTFDRHSAEIKMIIVDMAYQNGEGGQKAFKKTIAALNNFDYHTAAKEMKDSRWYGQSGKRSRNHVREVAEQ